MGMATAFITGATGFIGSHVALQLLQKGWRVRALKRPNSPAPCLEKATIEWFAGDIRHFEQVRSAMVGCETVFHVAADYRLWARNPDEIYESNVAGTANVLRAALLHCVERVVYTSSVGALGLRADGQPANEATPVHLDDMIGHYKRSKFLAEREAERFLSQGLPVVTVHPSTPVGPGDHKPTPTGKIIVDFLNRRMPAYLDTGLNLIHVSDVAAGHLLAMERGRVGEKYILGNRNLTLAEIFALLEKVSGIPAPRYRLPHRPILFLGSIFQAISKITGREPLIPYEGVKMARKFMYFDAGKAVRELGLPQTPVERALKDAVTWFREHGYVTRDRQN
jgi:dihydroflavonol-4-reductase